MGAFAHVYWDAKVNEFDLYTFEVVFEIISGEGVDDDYVLRFEIFVDDIMGVHVGDSWQDLKHYPANFLVW